MAKAAIIKKYESEEKRHHKAEHTEEVKHEKREKKDIKDMGKTRHKKK